MGADRVRLLIVDDDEGLRAAMRRLLDREHDVTLAPSAQVALDLLRSGARYDTILCDVNLSPMSGPELRVVLAMECPEQADAIVFITGGVHDPAREAALAALPNRRLAKPFTPAELFDVLRPRR